LVSQYSGYPTEGRFDLFINTNGTVRFFFGSTIYGNIDISAGLVLAGVNTNITLTRSGTNFKVYVDDIVIINQNSAASIYQGVNTQFGRSTQLSGGVPKSFVGLIRDIKLYNEALPIDQPNIVPTGNTKPDVWITDRYSDLYTTSIVTGSTVVDTISNLGSLSDLQLISGPFDLIKNNKGFTFTGDNYVIDNPSPDMLTGYESLNCSYWAKYDNSEQVGGRFVSLTGTGLFLVKILGGNIILFLKDNDGNTLNYWVAGSFTPSPTDWHLYHILVDRVNDRLHLYVDGENTYDNNNNINIITGEISLDWYFSLGYPTTGSLSFVGTTNDITFDYGTALTLEDCKSQYERTKFRYI